MKNLILFSILFSVFFVNGQRKPKIKGNRTITEVMEDLPAFNTIKLEDDLTIFLEASDIPGYSIVADDNLIDIIRFDVTDSVLVVRSFYQITGKKQLDITVKYRNLNKIIAEAGEVISSNQIDTENLDIEISETSQIELRAKATMMTIDMEGSSKGDFNIEADSININLRGKSNMSFYGLLQGVKLDMYENSQAGMEGTSDHLVAALYGNSDVRAEKMETATIGAILEEASKARFFAYKEFQLSASGTSKTYLWGNPSIFIKQFLNTTELYKREE